VRLGIRTYFPGRALSARVCYNPCAKRESKDPSACSKTRAHAVKQVKHSTYGLTENVKKTRTLVSFLYELSYQELFVSLRLGPLWWCIACYRLCEIRMLCLLLLNWIYIDLIQNTAIQYYFTRQLAYS